MFPDFTATHGGVPLTGGDHFMQHRCPGGRGSRGAGGKMPPIKRVGLDEAQVRPARRTPRPRQKDAKAECCNSPGEWLVAFFQWDVPLTLKEAL